MRVDKKYPHARILRVIEGLHKIVDNIYDNDPASINEIIEDFCAFDEACNELRIEILTGKLENSLEKIDEIESKQAIIRHLDEMRPIIEKMISLKAFW